MTVVFVVVAVDAIVTGVVAIIIVAVTVVVVVVIVVVVIPGFLTPVSDISTFLLISHHKHPYTHKHKKSTRIFRRDIHRQLRSTTSCCCAVVAHV